MLIPKANERDLVDIPDNVKDGLTIQPVETIDEVFKASFVTPPMPLKPQNLRMDNTESLLKN